MSSNRADNVTDPVRSKNSIAIDIIGREFPRSPGVRFFMQTGLDPFRFVIIAVAGWMNQYQQHAIDYLLEEKSAAGEFDSAMTSATGLRPRRRNWERNCWLRSRKSSRPRP